MKQNNRNHNCIPDEHYLQTLLAVSANSLALYLKLKFDPSIPGVQIVLKRLRFKALESVFLLWCPTMGLGWTASCASKVVFS